MFEIWKQKHEMRNSTGAAVSESKTLWPIDGIEFDPTTALEELKE